MFGRVFFNVAPIWVVSWYTAYGGVVDQFLRVFHCRLHGNEGGAAAPLYRLAHSADLVCDFGELGNLRIWAMAGCCVYGLMLPLYLLVSICKRRKHLHHCNTLRTFGFLYG